MNSRWIAFVMLSSLLAAPGLGQVEESKPTRAEKLVEQLGSPKFEERKEAAKELRELGEEARKALEAAHNDPDLERRMRVRALLEDLNAARDDGFRRSDSQVLVPEGARPEEAPREPRSFEEPQRDEMKRLRDMLEQQMAEMRKQLERMRGQNGLPPGATIIPPIRILPPNSQGRDGRGEIPLPWGGQDLRGRDAHSFEMHIVRGDQRLSLRRKANGELRLEVREPGEETRTYRAKDFEAFKQDHPEVYERYRDSGIFDQRNPGLGPNFPDRFGLGPDRPRLGIHCSPADPLLLHHLQLEGPRVVVTRVLPGSTAEKLGIREHDIILEIDGRSVNSVRDIREVIVGDSERIEVLVIHAGERQRLEGPRPGQ